MEQAGAWVSDMVLLFSRSSSQSASATAFTSTELSIIELEREEASGGRMNSRKVSAPCSDRCSAWFLLVADPIRKRLRGDKKSKEKEQTFTNSRGGSAWCMTYFSHVSHGCAPKSAPQ